MKIYQILILLIVGSGLNLPSVSMKAKKDTSEISYSASHSLHDWTGVNKDVNAVIVLDDTGNTIQKVAVSAMVSGFDSQNSSRDSHALEVLESLKYPKVQFVSTSISQQNEELDVKGNLTFHGVTKPVQFKAIAKKKDKGLEVEGEIPVSLEAYNVERPSFMLVKTEDTIKINFHLEFYP
ncbi:YceI family protein [Aquiflexum gelatinilyticum]|uniref:YceI family protein n=1 Tax=Aquiflexum gelatinilyticum TaxID=2961943 RepID=UPI002169527A|nr:YceI family protein [Aquiflexum gelatinilyticum]MCS4436472.1 YceI family protein [Aquiflexum gelatinilyticum]